MLCGANKDVFCPRCTHVIGFKVSEEDRTARTKLLCVVGGLLPYLAAGRQTGQGNWGRGRREREEAGGYDSSDRGSGRRLGRRDVGGTARHASARATWRETIRANNRQKAPPSWRERETPMVLNLARRGNNKAAEKWSSPMPRGVSRPFGRAIQTAGRNYS